MDVTKLTPGAVLPARTPDASAAAKSRIAAPSFADHGDIRPLDLRAALQILLAEVRASLQSELELAVGDVVLTRDEPPVAARGAVELFLRAIPDAEDVPDLAAWDATAAGAETALQAGLEQAVNVVSGWQSATPPIVDAVSEARDLVVSMLADAAPNPAWLRPEWAGLLPRFDRYRRRRRAARRLRDPDYAAGSFDNNDEDNL